VLKIKKSMVEIDNAIIPSFIMGDKENLNITKLMWTIVDEAIPIMEIGEAHICLTRRTRLNRLKTEMLFHVDEIYQNTSDS
jgi:hypothetical protein